MYLRPATRYLLLSLLSVLACLVGPGCLTPDLRAGERAASTTGRVPHLTETVTEDEELDRALAYLAAGIAEPIRDGEQAKIAVLDFVDLNGRTTRLGMFLAEELITRLFETGQFEVVERRLLTKVLKEQNLSESGLIEAKSAMTLGSILGVKAIVVGTVTDLGTKLKVNARVISAQTGALTSAAQANISKNENVARLYEAVVDSSGTALSDEAGTGSDTDAVSRRGYHQDFSNVEEGLLPPEFTAGDDLGVRENKGKRYLATFVRGDHKFVINDVPFPDDFAFQWVMETTEIHAYDWAMSVGDFRVSYRGKFTGGAIYATNTDAAEILMKRGTIYVFVVEKRGDVLRVFLDGQKRLVTRISGMETPRTISFTTKMGFRLHQLTVEPLPDANSGTPKLSATGPTP